jgi:hypothetical protein
MKAVRLPALKLITLANLEEQKMTSTPSFQNSWQAYQKAVSDLYAAPLEVVATAERSVGEIYAEQFEAQSEVVLNLSEAVRTSLTPTLQSDDLAQRELASLKLLAAAAYDLAIANDMLELEERGPTPETERSGHGAILAADDLLRVLNAPLEGRGVGLLEVERAALPSDPQAARAMLEDTIANFVEVVPEAAVAISQTAVAGVINLERVS